MTNEDDPKQRIKNGQLLQVIRERPTLYLGERSLSALWHYLQGFWMALSIHDIRTEYILPPDFHDWVAYRLHFFESTSGYRNMILKRVPNESTALDRFFELVDEHRNRKPRVVAKLEGYSREYRLYHGSRENEKAERFPTTLTLISYTDDPGFFVGSDDESAMFPGRGFVPTLEAFAIRFHVRKENLMVLEPDIYTHWVEQQGRFKSKE